MLFIICSRDQHEILLVDRVINFHKQISLFLKKVTINFAGGEFIPKKNVLH